MRKNSKLIITMLFLLLTPSGQAQQQPAQGPNPASLPGEVPQGYQTIGETNRYLHVLPTVDRETKAQPAARRPIVLLIITDDQGYGDLSLHGNEQIREPVETDALAPS